MSNNLYQEEIGKHYAGIFASFCQSVSKYDQQLSELLKQERAVTGTKEDYMLAIHDVRIDRDGQIKKVAREMIKGMVCIAEKMFAPEGSRLSIDKMVVTSACGYSETDDRWGSKINWAEFSATKVWDHLVATYGGEKGKEEGYRQTALAIARAFYLKPGKPVRMVGGRLVLELSVYIDSFDKKHSNVNRISYSCIEGIGKAINALYGFATWAGFDALAQALREAQNELGGCRSEITSRAKYCGYGIKIITFLNRYEFQIDPPVAEQLQLFLSMYAFPELQEAA
jgi:hypothetical protein